MTLALREAQKAYERDEVPIGAVIVSNNNGEVLAVNGNRTREKNNPCAHAEILVIEEACNRKGAQRIPECDLYVTVEPCPMCASAASFARINTVIFGAIDEKSGGAISGPRLYESPAIHHKPHVISGILASDCGTLMTEFFKGKR